MPEAKLRRIDALEHQTAMLSQELNALRQGLGDLRRARDAERSRLREAHDRLIAAAAEAAAIAADFRRLSYEQLILRIRAVVETSVPVGRIVLVVSKGDDRLLQLGRRTGWHFLQTPEGVYAGHHPANSDAAIAELERLRLKRAAYLVIPKTGLWWLSHYAGFREHLDRRYRSVVQDERTCVIYALTRPWPHR